MTLYNLSNISTSNSTLDIIKYINLDLTHGMLLGIVLIVLFFVMLLSYNVGDFKLSLLIVSFFMVILTGLFWLSGLIPFFYLIFALAILVIAIILFFVAGG